MCRGPDYQPAPAGAGHPSHLVIEANQKEKCVVYPEEEISDPSQHVPGDDELAQEWRRKGRSKYLNASWPPQPSHSSCTIFRAPYYMREYYNKAFQPSIVTIGLFHFGMGESLSPRLHKHKSDCVSSLLARHGSNEKAAELLEECMNLVLELEPRARSCYSVDDGKVNRQEFAEMLLQDGCFILSLLLRVKMLESQEVAAFMSELDSWDSEITIVPTTGRLWLFGPMVHDLVKLENQIPFFVLQDLLDLLKTPDDTDIDLVELALKLLKFVDPARAETFKPPPSSNVLHLLHLFHSSLIPPKLEETTVEVAPDWTPSATVLQDAGVKFRPPKKRRAESFLDVTFENGVMEIPPLLVFDDTCQIFHNLIAFEQFYLVTKTHITNYARFMDCLVNTTRDVRLLSLDGVLQNRLTTEEAAADFFNNICNHAYYNPNTNYLCKVFTDVTEYYESPWHKWRATFLRNYFSNPWTIISVLAAVVLLLLTIEQAVFAGLSYFRPPS